MDVFLSSPFLAKCNDRNCLPKINQSAGSPEDWFTPERIGKYNLFSFSFDFFVNWSSIPPRLTRNLWVKSIINVDPRTLCSSDGIIDGKTVLNLLNAFFGSEVICSWHRFANHNKAHLEFLIFREVDWQNHADEVIVFSRSNQKNGEIGLSAKLISLSELKHKIMMGSGGPVFVGNKGLIYGTSLLECYLSQGNSAYPGDADLLLIDKQSLEPFAILEFKKHTLNSPTREQQISNYYPNPDKRKYDRLFVLKSFFQNKPILANLYYPTRADSTSKVEIIDGEYGNLRATNSTLIELPSLSSKGSMDNYVDTVISFLMGLTHENK